MGRRSTAAALLALIGAAFWATAVAQYVGVDHHLRRQFFEEKRRRGELLKVSNLEEGEFGELPKNFDWREERTLIPPQNQHLPKYCGSCWSFAPTATIADRFIVKHNSTFSTNIPLSNQVVVSCAGAGSCTGGFSEGVFEYAIHHGIPDDTCSPYQAESLSCSQFLECGTCLRSKCVAVSSYKPRKIVSFGFVSGDEAIMNEVHNNGPVVCYIYASEYFLTNYTGGVYLGCETVEETNHAVSIVGWGETLDFKGRPLPYWIFRNSWGTAWGEAGYFRIPRSSYHNGKCSLSLNSYRCMFPVVP